MNYLNKLCLSIATIVSFSCFGMQLVRDEHNFRFHDGKQEYVVKPHFVDPLLKRMSPEQMRTFVEQGNRIRAIRLSNGEHRLQAMVPGKGGGPISGLIAYWATKSLCYGTAAAAATTAVVATGGAAAAVTGAGATILAGTVAAGAGTAVVVGGVTAEAAAVVAAGGLAASAGMVEGAALATTAVVSSAGSIAAAIAAVESASLGAGAFFAAIPFLP